MALSKRDYDEGVGSGHGGQTGQQKSNEGGTHLLSKDKAAL